MASADLRSLALLSILVSLACAAWIAADEFARPQPMRIMNVVWPVTGLYAGPIALWAYYRFGRAGGNERHDRGESKGGPAPSSAIAKSTLHCGAGCTLGDLIAETLLAALPGAALLLGWKTLWQERIFSAWVLDFIAAFVLGILFQYFAIKPMHLRMSRTEALRRALQADTLSLLSWQVGMYAVMALAHFWIFPHLVGVSLPPAGLEFWWVMQFAMLAGFLTAYPINRWLIGKGVKEAM